MHKAKLETSHRLQKVAILLADGKAYTTMDIIKHCCVCAVNSIISELRENGFDIKCTRKKDIWEYQMIGGNTELLRIS